MSPGVYPNTTIQGTVIATLPLLDVQDDTGTLIVNPDSPVNVKLGDVIRAEGTLVSERFRIHLNDARVRVLWSDVPIPPLAVNADELTGGTYRGRFIELEATLISADTTSEGYQLLLRDRETTFSAVGSNDFHLEANRLRPGSRLRLQGTATSLSEFTHDLYPFIVVVNRVDVIAPPPWWSPEHIALAIAAIVALFLGAQFLLHRMQQWHLRAILKEREQLAYEMHDTLSQSFTGIAYQLEAANLERRGESQIRQHIQNALRMVHLSHREASRTIAALRPQFRDAAAILAALRSSALRMSDGGALAITTQLRGKNRHLPIQIADALYRIGQEAISNAIQHAEAKHLEIALSLTNRDVEFSIRDNGRGFTPEQITGTLGLSGMRARANRIKAMLEIHSQSGAGTTILVKAQIRFAGSLLYRLRTTLSPYPES
jgi:signal transduction histidine kinase